MPRSLRWLLVLIVAFFVLVATVALVAVSSSGRARSVRAGSVLLIELDGEIPERDLRSPLALALEGEKPSLHEITNALRRAATDRKVKAAYLKCRGFSAGWGKLQELRDAMEAFRKAGKKIYATLEFGRCGEYFVAAGADEVYLPPSGVLDISGLMSDVPFYKGTLDKIGVRAELEHIGDYKSASDIFTRDSMSGAQREATNAVLDSLARDLHAGLAALRRLTEKEVEGDIDRGMFTAEEAKKAKLVDDLLYEDQVEERIEKEVGKDFPRVRPARYGRVSEHGAGPRIAIVYAGGIIVSGESGSDPFGGEMMGSETLVEALRAVREDKSVKAVVLRVDSPGGSALASDVIWRETQLLRKEKPLVVSMGDVAASGGYYIAMGADSIVAQPQTLTGSIGIISGKFNLHGFYDWIGLRREQIKRGANADLFSDYTAFTPQQRQLILGQMAAFYHEFVGKAAEGRKRKTEEIDRVGQGRVWTGRQAVEIGLADELGGLDRATEIAREKAGIPAGRSISYVIYPRKKTLWEMFSRADRDTLSRLPLPRELRRLAIVWAAASRLEGEAVLAWNPDL